MTFLLLAILCVTTISAQDIVDERESEYSPLVNCSTEMMDVLFLFFTNGDSEETLKQKNVAELFADHITSFHLEKTTPYVMFAAVYDRFSAHNLNINVTTWKFHPKFNSNFYGENDPNGKPHAYTNMNETIEQKATFVKRLFSEMAGVRGNVTHVAVIFLNGFSLSQEEMKIVPKFVNRQDSDIKIFISVFNGRYAQQLKTAFSYNSNEHFYLTANFLAISICNQCVGGLWQFQHIKGTDPTSCFYLYDEGNDLVDYLGPDSCFNNGMFPATFESQEQFTFIQSKLRMELTKLGINYTTEVHIGLTGDIMKVEETLHWLLTYPIRSRPLVINHWLSGQPSGGHGKECVVWQFMVIDHTSGKTNVSSSESYFVDGWRNVECETRARFTLCEVDFPRRLGYIDLITIKPARNESFSQILIKNDFIKYGDNIVSISTHVAEKQFNKFLSKENIELFPLYDCGENAETYRYISYLLVCNERNDCSNNIDESHCLPRQNSVPYLRNDKDCRDNCKGIYCCNGVCFPLIYDNDGHINCHACVNSVKHEVVDEDHLHGKYLEINRTSAFICHRGECTLSPELTSSMNDCNRPERLINEYKGNRSTHMGCKNNLGYSLWAPSCVYVKHTYGAVLDCRLSKLEQCKDIICPEGYVKCPNTYCIPQHYVLDGQEDCPTGEDEQADIIGPCNGNFACWDSRVCLHPDLVCDGHPDCPHLDDEIDCNEACAEGFRCVSGTVTVTNSVLALKNLRNQKYKNTFYLDYSGLDLSIDYYAVSELENIMFIDWSNCNITDLVPMIDISFRLVQWLDVSFNLIREFDGSQINFYKLNNIRSLNLSHNRRLDYLNNLQYPFLQLLDLSYTGLSILVQSALSELPKLDSLDLSFTFISSFDGKIKFTTNFYLQTLNVRGLAIDNLYEDYFNGLSVSEHLYTDRFDLCCPLIRGPNIPSHVCHAPDDAISSCSDLLADNIQRILLWTVGLFSVLGNMTTIIYHIIWNRSVLRTGYGLFVTNLGISDFIMGVYLFIIAGADYYYRGVYVLYDKNWRESFACKFAGFLATLSSETSKLFILLITVERFLMMKFPLGEIKFSKINTTLVLLVSWFIGFTLATVPIPLHFEMNSSNAMCLGLPLTTERLKGWEFSFSVVVVLNFFLCLITAVGQRVVFRTMSKKRCAISSTTSSRRAQDIIVAKQLSLVALFNFLGWFPIGFMGLLSLVGVKINNCVLAWTTVIVLPINSAANPLLYTIPVLMDKWEQFKFR